MLSKPPTAQGPLAHVLILYSSHRAHCCANNWTDIHVHIQVRNASSASQALRSRCDFLVQCIISGPVLLKPQYTAPYSMKIQGILEFCNTLWGLKIG